jgi:hypothetical protein
VNGDGSLPGGYTLVDRALLAMTLPQRQYLPLRMWMIGRLFNVNAHPINVKTPNATGRHRTRHILNSREHRVHDLTALPPSWVEIGL